MSQTVLGEKKRAELRANIQTAERFKKFNDKTVDSNAVDVKEEECRQINKQDKCVETKDAYEVFPSIDSCSFKREKTPKGRESS